MKIVGLTGVAGSGKSEAGRIFERLGAKVIDADKIARNIYEEEGLTDKLRAMLDAEQTARVFEDGAQINRRALRLLISEDPVLKRKLDELTHGAIMKKIGGLVAAAMADGAELTVVEAALIFGYGFERFFDKIIVVTANEEEIVKRIAARDGVSEDEARKLVQMQGPQSALAFKADFVADNAGSVDALSAKIENIYAQLLN